MKAIVTSTSCHDLMLSHFLHVRVKFLFSNMIE